MKTLVNILNAWFDKGLLDISTEYNGSTKNFRILDKAGVVLKVLSYNGSIEDLSCALSEVIENAKSSQKKPELLFDGYEPIRYENHSGDYE